MSRMTVQNQLLLNDGLGNKLPIQTGTWVSGAINIEEQRRLSITIGVQSATGAAGDAGGFTGTLLVQGTDELANCGGATGTPEAGNNRRPGSNSQTGALFWQTIPSGTAAITSATSKLLLSFTDVGVNFVRVCFNATGWAAANGSTTTGCLGGSGTMQVFLTAKNT